MKAVVLCAGEGTRLLPLTLTVPKPMVPVGNEPLVRRTARILAVQGFRQIAANTFHHSTALQKGLGKGDEWGISIRYSREERLLGTAGGVKRMEGFLNQTFVVIYGDNLWQADLSQLLAYHREKGGLATVATFKPPDTSGCGLIVADHEGRITRVQEKPSPRDALSGVANAGVYVLEPSVLRYIPARGFSDFSTDIFPVLLETGEIYATSLGGHLRDTGTPDGYRGANWDVVEGRVGRTPDHRGRRTLAAGSAHIDAGACLLDRNVVGARCSIANGATVSESVLWEGCVVESGATIRKSILGRNVLIKSGAFVDENTILADGAVVESGALVPADARIGPGERVAIAGARG